MRSFTIYDIFTRNALLFKNRTAIVCNDQRLSFDELLKQVNSLAAGFEAIELNKGDRIAILANNCHKFFWLFGAAAQRGIIVVLVNWRLSDEEIQFILQDSGTKALFVDKNHGHRVPNIINDTSVKHIFGFDASVTQGSPMDDLMKSADVSATAIENDDPFCLIYTAAVQGKPRGAVLSHGNIVFGNMQTSATMLLTSKDAYLNMLPLFHITGLNLSFSVMHVGGKNVVVEKFDEKETLRQTGIEKITALGSFPPILSRLYDELHAGNYDVSSLRHLLGLDSPENIIPFEEKTGASFWMLYGQSETSGLATFSPSADKRGSAGRPGLLTRVNIVDENDHELPLGQTGEIVVQGPVVFQGYWKQDALNEKTFRNGWHHTGDNGRFDEDGFLWFAGRKPEKELIKPGGENVYPAEVEEVILQHPSVQAVSVIGIPDPKFGEGVKAVCELKPGASLTATELKDFVASRIARYKKPGYVEFVEKLPRTSSGAIDRQKVKEKHG